MSVVMKKMSNVLRIPVITALLGLLFAVSVFAEDKFATITVPSGYTTDVTDFQVDGVSVTPVATDEANTFRIPVEDYSKFITAIQYNRDKTDPTAYPQHMATWEVSRRVERTEHQETGNSEETGETGVITYTEETVTFPVRRMQDDILGYNGFAIKPPEKDDDGNVTRTGGIRSYLSVPTSIKSDGLVIDGDTSYRVIEYGHLHIFSRNWNSGSKDNMLVGKECVLKSACYIKDSRDIVFEESGDRTIFANSLFDIVDYSVMKYFRGYIKLRSTADGSEMYLYGPVVGRNPQRVAEQALDNPNESDRIKTFAQEVLNIVDEEATHERINAYFIGDSIMLGKTLKRGVTPSGSPSAQSDYTQTAKQPSVLIGEGIADETGKEVKCTLIANGGATYSKPGANLYNMQRLSDIAINTATNSGVTPDYIFLLAGVNDWAYRDHGQGLHHNTAEFGDLVRVDNEPEEPKYYITNEFRHVNDPVYARYSPTDKDTYCLGFERTIQKLMTQYPTSKIIVLSPLRAWWDSGEGTLRVNESTGKRLHDYVFVQEAATTTYNRDGENIYYVNLYDLMLRSEYMNLPGTVPERAANFATYFPDGFHPTQEGYNIMCRIVIDQMRSQNLFN